MKPTLTHEELTDIIGSPQHVKQDEWLTARDWKHEVRVDGSMSVLRAEMERRMLSSDRSVRKRIEPDLDALHHH